MKYVLKLPHYFACNSEVYFLGDKIGEISNEATSLHQILPDNLCVVDGFSPDIVCELIRTRALIECTPPKKPSSKAPLLVVISPHIDDCMFSIGGLLLRLASLYQIHVISLFSIDPYTTVRKLKKDFSWLQRLKLEEENCAASLIYATTSQMAWNDALLRSYKEITDQIHKDEPISQYENELSAHLPKNPSLVLSPVGITHVDHRLTRLLVNRLKHTEVLYNTPIFYYEDLPYASCKDLINSNSFQSLNILLSDDELEIKKKMIKIYMSQLSPGLLSKILNHRNGQECLWFSPDEGVNIQDTLNIISGIQIGLEV